MTDLLYQDRDLQRTDDGDIETIDGVTALKQQIRLIVSDEVTALLGDPLTAESAGRLESQISRAIDRRSDVSIVDTRITEIDRRSDSLTAKVATVHNGVLETEIQA